MSRIAKPGCTGLCPFVLGVLCLVAAAATAAPPVDPESALKAALIYKLAKFVAWPGPSPAAEGATSAPESAAKATSRFQLCVRDDGNFSSALGALANRSIGARPISIHPNVGDADIAKCDLIYFDSMPSAERIKEFAALPILTVSDAEGFAVRGGMVEITRRRNRLGFRINAKSAREAGLTVAAPLLDLATVVER